MTNAGMRSIRRSVSWLAGVSAVIVRRAYRAERSRRAFRSRQSTRLPSPDATAGTCSRPPSSSRPTRQRHLLARVVEALLDRGIRLDRHRVAVGLGRGLEVAAALEDVADLRERFGVGRVEGGRLS